MVLIYGKFCWLLTNFYPNKCIKYSDSHWRKIWTCYHKINTYSGNNKSFRVFFVKTFTCSLFHFFQLQRKPVPFYSSFLIIPLTKIVHYFTLLSAVISPINIFLRPQGVSLEKIPFLTIMVEPVLPTFEVYLWFSMTFDSKKTRKEPIKEL